jgi:hypothetical protein
VDSLVVKGSSCKKKETDWHLYILEELWPKKELRAGEVLKVDTGCIVGFTKDVDYDIEFIGGIKNSFWWRRFILRHPGPGTVYAQYHFSRLADRIIASAPKAGGSRGEGSILAD